MARKKKTALAEQPTLEKKEEPMPPAMAAPPLNGQQAHIEESPALLAAIKARASDVARECGLREPFLVTGPDRVDYPVRGHGYIVVVKEQTGKQRMGSARFNSEGEHRYWSIDGIVTG